MNQGQASPTADPAVRAYTIPEAARLLKVSDSHLYRLAKRGQLPGAIHLGAAVRISRIQFDAWLAATNSGS